MERIAPAVNGERSGPGPGRYTRRAAPLADAVDAVSGFEENDWLRSATGPEREP